MLGNVQASWVGEGWNIDGVEIVRKITTSDTGYGYQDSYALTMNGTMYQLMVDPTHPNRYYTDHDSFLYIERHNYSLGNALDNSQTSPQNTSGEWWEVVTTDGTRYRLGWNNDSEQLALMYGYSCTVGYPCTTPNGAYASLGYAGKGTNLVALRWRVDRVMDTHGNYMSYAYYEEHPVPSSQTPAFDRASYLQIISYTAHVNGAPAGYQVAFQYGNRVGDGVPAAFNLWDNYDTQQLNEIDVCYGLCSSGTIVRKYQLGYTVANVPDPNGTLTLTSLAVSGGGFSEQSQAIPATPSATIRFTYNNLQNRATSGTTATYPYPRLTQIDNGYGGTLNYVYQNDGRDATQWYDYRVQNATVSSGVSTASIRGYAYATPVYTGASNTGALIGYTDTTETTYDFNGTIALSSMAHHFGTTGLDTGYELATSWMDSAGTVLKKAVNTYVVDNSKAPFLGWNYHYVYQTQNYLKSGASLVQTSSTVSMRDPSTGNLSVQQNYLGSSLYRKTYYEYLPNFNPTIYILDKPTRALVTNASNAIYADTRYGYNGVGDLTLAQKVVTGSQTSDTTFNFDGYGNRTSSCAYTAYGTIGIVPVGSCNLSQTQYDQTLYTYPTQTTNPLNQAAQTSYLYALGLPFQTTDPNGWITSTTYDGLGRTRSVTPPGLGTATGATYSYPSPDSTGHVTAPYAIQMQIWDQPANQNRSVWGLYDGLGRILETQSLDSDQSKLLVSDSYYNAQGLVFQQSSPYSSFYSGTNGGTMQSGAVQYIVTGYDALGRAIQVTAPGNINTTTAYDGLTTTITDPNGNKTARTMDGLGRLSNVQEYNGASVYAATLYSYDIANHLLTTTDAQSNVTTLQYDLLGRKTNMQDPDMGVWSYQYDPLGNLQQQTDARTQKLGFSYDTLNRLTDKVDATNGNAPLAHYTYGTTVGQIGLRVGMTDPSGSTSWTYSNYGRTVTENRTISGITQSTTSSSDWLGRALSVTYPDTEVVSYQYDALGRPKNFSGSAQTGNLADLAYNTLSQITSLNLKNGVSITNTYDTSTNRLSERKAQLGTNVLLDFSYYYDSTGNITTLNDKTLGESQSFQYDSLNRLISAQDSKGNAYPYRQTFQYDPIGDVLAVNNWQTTDVIFKDDFESGNFSSWSANSSPTDIWTVNKTAVVPPSGQNSAIFDIHSITPLYLQDNSPHNETSYRARFYVRPDGLTIAAGDVVDLFVGLSNGSPAFHIEMQYTGGAYQVRSGLTDNNNLWTNSAWVSIPNGWSALETWDQVQTNTGSLMLWVNGVQGAAISGINNGNHVLTGVQLGALGTFTTATHGQLGFDAFESRRLTYIGLVPQQIANSANNDMVAYHIPVPSNYNRPNAPQPQVVNTATPTPTPTGFIFKDGFESGNFSLWSWTDTNAGNLSVLTPASAIGSYGMQAVVQNTNPMRAYYQTTAAQAHYSARFYFNPNSIQIPPNQGIYIFSAGVAALYLQQAGQYYSISPCIKDFTTGNWNCSQRVYIPNGWQSVEIEWQTASSSTVHDGYLNMWIDNTLAGNIPNLANDAALVSIAFMGMDGIPAGTTGTMYYDGFESWKGQRIGLDPSGPALQPPLIDLLFLDGFESGNFSPWSWASTDAGNMSVSALAAAIGSYGMQAHAVVNDTNSMKVNYQTTAAQAHYSARFYFNPNSIQIPPSQGFYIFAGSNNLSAWVTSLYLQQVGLNYSLSLCGKDETTGNWSCAPAVIIPNSWQSVEIEWKTASSSTVHDGYLNLWVDNTLAGNVANLNNDAELVSIAFMGMDSSRSAQTSGTMYYDGFESWRGQRIGLDPKGPVLQPPLSSTSTPTATYTATATNTPTYTPTNTSTLTLMYTPSNTPTNTATPTRTLIPTKTSTPTSTSTPTPFPFASAKSWTYDTTVDGWFNNNPTNVSGFGWQTGGYIGGTIIGIDPFIYSADNLGIDITNNKTIKVRFKNTSSSSFAQFYFITTTDGVWNEAKDKTFAVLPNSDYTEYIVDMSGMPGWTGTLRELRFDPAVGVTTGSFSVDYILIGTLNPTPTPTAAPTFTPTATWTPTSTPTATSTPAPIQAAKWSFDETSGATVLDTASGSPVSNGTITGALRVPGFGVNALQFASGQYVNLLRTTEMEPINGFTISAWLYPTQINANTTYVILNKGGASQDYRLFINTNGFLDLHVNGLTPTDLLGPSLPLNTWTHVAAVYDRPASLTKLYVNGSLVASKLVTGAIAYNTSAGITFSDPTTSFIGMLDEIQFYSGALPDSTIANLSNLSLTATPNPTSTATSTPTLINTNTPTRTPTSTPAFSPTPLPSGNLPWGTGNDGNLNVATGATYNINTQNQSGRTCADGGDAVAYSVTSLGNTAATLSVSPSSGCLIPGDEIMLMNPQGTTTYASNTGAYEFLRISYITGSMIVFTTSKVKWYGDGYRSDNGIGVGAGQQRVMLMRVPNYNNVTVNGTLTANAWDGNKNGALVFRVANSLTGTGLIHVNGLGYQGGDDAAASKFGESNVGWGNSGYGGGAPGATGYDLYRGIGGGGAYGTNGLSAGGSSDGAGGIPYGDAQLGSIYVGSGGGAGGDVRQKNPNGETPAPPDLWGGTGGRGGGMLLVAGMSINFQGTITSNGVNGTDHGGGGAGGGARIEAYDISQLTVNALGGYLGGQGRIAVYYQHTLSGLSGNPSVYTALLGLPPTPSPTPTSISFSNPIVYGTGADGDLTVASGVTFNPSTQNTGTRSCAQGGDGVSYQVISLINNSVQLSTSPAANCLVVGDELLLINLRGTPSNYANVGNYEFLRVGGMAGNVIYFQTPKARYYGANAGDDSNVGNGSGQQRVVIYRVPNYRNVTINGTLTSSAWNGSGNGLIVLRASGTFSGSGAISANGLGYRTSGNWDIGTGVGEGPAANSGSFGGGGDAGQTSTCNYKVGGGGGYGTNGIRGTGNRDGFAGNGYGDLKLNQISFGAGGGNGGYLNSDGSSCNPGASGGGAIFLNAQTISFTGSIASNGVSFYNGGPGAGGAVRIEGYSVSLNTVTVTGGTGSNGTNHSYGGAGRIAVYYDNSFSGNFTPDYLEDTTPGSATPTPTATSVIATPQPPAAGWVGTSYTYTQAHPHAVTALSGGSSASYIYDANGNMTCRVENGVTFTQGYNAENRLATVKKLSTGNCAAPGQIATQWDFAYDGDGTRVKQVVSTYDQSTPQNITGIAITAYFMGGAYEVTTDGNGATLGPKKYYAIAGMTVAMNNGGGLQYLLTDHLGSVVAVTNASGTLTSQQRYLPFGQVRTDTPSIPNSPSTDFGYTGQRSLSMGLMDYHARFYDSTIGRFISPDTIIPSMANPQSWNRFSYVMNNPVNLIDPSGYISCEGNNKDDGPQCVYFKNGGPKKLNDFKKLSWQQRRDWLDIFVEQHGLGNWFDDIKNAISGFMAHDPILNQASGATYYMDAAVLQEINNGWNMYQHGSGAVVGGDKAVAGAAGWANFFSVKAQCDVTPKCNPDSLIDERLTGENQGVNSYAWPMTIQSGMYAQDDELAQAKLSAFLLGANAYRSMGIHFPGICAGGWQSYCDPRHAGPFLVDMGQKFGNWGMYAIYGFAHEGDQP